MLDVILPYPAIISQLWAQGDKHAIVEHALATFLEKYTYFVREVNFWIDSIIMLFISIGGKDGTVV